MVRAPKAAARGARDPLQVNLRRVVQLILLVVLLPTTILTGIGIVVIVTWEEPLDLVLGILEISFAASVIAGAILLIYQASRGARLARIQDTFLSQMGHEILTPLSGIRLHTQILEGMQLPEGSRLSVQAIRREADRLRDLVQRTLRWREMRSTKHLYRKRSTTTGEIVEQVLQRLPNKNMIHVRLLTTDTRLRGDPDALAEAVMNLTGNARKYAGDDSPIELTVRKLGKAVIFVVSDRGPGLPKEDAERIFDPFYRIVPKDRPDPGGTGLGLTITRQIVRAHRGAINALNRRGGGSRFFIHLPMEGRQ